MSQCLLGDDKLMTLLCKLKTVHACDDFILFETVFICIFNCYHCLLLHLNQAANFIWEFNHEKRHEKYIPVHFCSAGWQTLHITVSVGCFTQPTVTLLLHSLRLQLPRRLEFCDTTWELCSCIAASVKLWEYTPAEQDTRHCASH